MSTFKTTVVAIMIVLLGAALALDLRSRRKLQEELLAVKAEVQQLVEQLASLQQERQANLSTLPAQTSDVPVSENPVEELSRLRAELAQLRERLTQLEKANAALSNQMASASGANDPFVYPDSRRKKDYAFAGYAAPQSSLQSLLWAITQSDPKAFQASLAAEMASAFASQFQDLPEGVMPGGFKNGSMYQASGYRVLEETPLPNDEVRVKVFLEGKPKVTVKLVFKKVGDQWKWARNE